MEPFDWVFEIIIWGFLILDIPLLYWIISKSNANESIKKVILSCAVFAWLVIFYGSFIEPNLLVINEQSISLSDQPTHETSIAIISDLHVGPFKKANDIERLVNKIDEQQPDMVFILGDFVFRGSDPLTELTPLYFLVDNYPVYAILGNHDYDLGTDNDPNDDELANTTKAVLRTLGITVLENQGTYIADDKLYLAGLKEIWTDDYSIDQALGLRSGDTPTILLSHNPDIIREVNSNQNIDLVLAGHTHGGQIRLPFFGAIGPIPDELGQSYDKGFFEEENTTLFITSGTGESGTRARLFNPPEIVLMTIKY